MRRMVLLITALSLLVSPAFASRPRAWSGGPFSGEDYSGGWARWAFARPAGGGPAEIFSWRAGSGGLAEEAGGATGTCARTGSVLRINPETGIVETVSAGNPVFEKPFSRETPALRLSNAFFNQLAVAGTSPTELLTGWHEWNAAIGDDVTAAPLSGSLADAIVPDAVLNAHSVYSENPVAASPGQRVFLSSFLKAGTGSDFAALALNLSSDAEDPLASLISQPGVAFNLAGGTVAQAMDFMGAGVAPANAFITPCAGGWFYAGFEISAPAATQCAAAQCVAMGPGGEVAFSGNSVTGHGFFWGVNLTVNGPGWHPAHLHATQSPADQISWPMPESVAPALAASGTLVLEFAPGVSQTDGPAANSLVAASDAAFGILFFNGTCLASTDGTNTATASLSFARGNRYLAAVQWDKAAGTFRVGTRSEGEDWVFGAPAPFGGFPAGETLTLGLDPAWPFYAGRLAVMDGLPTDAVLNADYGL